MSRRGRSGAFMVPVAVLVAVVALVASLLPVAGAEAAGKRPRAVSGWFGYWTDADEMARVADSSEGTLGEVNIFWWHFAGPDRPICTTDAGGGCLKGSSSTPWTAENFEADRRALQDRGILVFATHTDLASQWAGALSEYLATQARRQSMADTMTEWVVGAGVDGVDLDWENFAFNDGSKTWSTTRPRFTDFVRRLGEALHAKGKLLSVTVPGGYRPFNDDGTPNPGGGYSVFDWAGLAPNVDRLRLMTYDYSWNRPGPIGPHWWARESVRSAVAQVGQSQKSKVYVGLHQYGKAWFRRDSNDDVMVVGDCPEGWKPTSSDAIPLSPAAARSLALSYSKTPTFDTESRELTFDYVKSEPGRWIDGTTERTQACRVRKQVWFGSAGTAAGRAEIVSEFGIGGVATWQLASLDEGYFAALAPLTAGSTASPSPSPSPSATQGPAPKPTTTPTPGRSTRYRLALKVRTTKVRAGRTIKVRGRISPKEAGTKVKRQRRVGSRWRTLATSVTDSKGVVVFAATLNRKPDRYTYRLVAARTSGHKVLRSATVTVRAVK